MRVVYNHGIYLPDINLWLDATRPRDRSVISHAHADHIQRHASIIATPATVRLCEHRLGWTRATRLDFGEPEDYRDFTLTFYPAGHCLGSAQTLIEYEGERLLYTGDFKLRPGLSCERAEIVPCDTLIIDCTFGRPQYVFPNTDELHELLFREIDMALLYGVQPAVMAYSLGKSQEALRILLRAGYSVDVHESIVAIVEIYREMGVEFEGDYRAMNESRRQAEQPRNGRGLVALLPSHFRAERGDELGNRYRNAYTIFLTGWGMDRRASRRCRASAVLPLSDHAGFDDLERYVHACGAKKIYTAFGDDYFASHLRQSGFDAEPLHGFADRAGRASQEPKTSAPQRDLWTGALF